MKALAAVGFNGRDIPASRYCVRLQYEGAIQTVRQAWEKIPAPDLILRSHDRTDGSLGSNNPISDHPRNFSHSSAHFSASRPDLRQSRPLTNRNLPLPNAQSRAGPAISLLQIPIHE